MTKTEPEAKPPQIVGKIECNEVEAKSSEAKPENINVKNVQNSSVEDKSSPSEAKPVVAESPVKSTEASGDPARPKCSQPELKNIRNSIKAPVDKQPGEATQEQSECPPDAPLPAQEDQSSPRSAGDCQVKAVVSSHPAAARTTSRRVPPGGHCSQLW